MELLDKCFANAVGFARGLLTRFRVEDPPQALANILDDDDDNSFL